MALSAPRFGNVEISASGKQQKVVKPHPEAHVYGLIDPTDIDLAWAKENGYVLLARDAGQTGGAYWSPTGGIVRLVVYNEPEYIDD